MSFKINNNYLHEMNNATQFANDFIESDLISEGKKTLYKTTNKHDSMILLNEKKNKKNIRNLNKLCLSSKIL